jgi:hypothetical protein
MSYPKIIILAIGGSHGDFLLKSCEIMTHGKIKDSDVDLNGRADYMSTFKTQTTLQTFKKGKKQKLEINYKTNDIELSHIYYEEFQNFTSKFYYIDFDKKYLDIVLDMCIEKVCNNNIDKAIEYFKEYIIDGIAKKINKTNYREILKLVWWNGIKKYKKLKDIESIDMLSFYNFDEMCKILKKLNVYNKENLTVYEKFYQKWYNNNKKFINKF